MIETIIKEVSNIDTLIKGLGALMVIDIFTGVLLALKEKKFNSSIGKNGVLLKLSMIAGLAFAYIADILFNTNSFLRTSFTWLMIGYEGASIVENLGNVGLKVPKYISDRFEQIKQKEGE